MFYRATGLTPSSAFAALQTMPKNGRVALGTVSLEAVTTITVILATRFSLQLTPMALVSRASHVWNDPEFSVATLQLENLHFCRSI
jgi:hypothetical protein